jgi:hypothetical protein
MSYFADLSTTLITTEIAFGVAAVGSRSYMQCKGGEIVAWEYDHADDAGYIIINIYNATTGTDELVSTVYTMPGCDIFRGLFSSGAVPTKEVTDSDCIYYRVDYI